MERMDTTQRRRIFCICFPAEHPSTDPGSPGCPGMESLGQQFGCGNIPSTVAGGPPCIVLVSQNAMAWKGPGNISWFQSPAMGRDTVHSIRVCRTRTSLAFHSFSSPSCFLVAESSHETVFILIPSK
ncbi:hypothetical protein DUI87_08725 [Hirundo rustica rustica]|uniref:Uncharacterized protein n=1 Tax=Hirundo rustica rustica TaxID=333673 RepID=A0A3M0KK69_HIRRU|nr:hypothetical protein DUI87_08725 [Hirundo rustica rustica]